MIRFLIKDRRFFLPLPPPEGDNSTPLPQTGLHTPPPAGDSQTIIKKKRLMKGNCFLRRFFTRFPQGWRFSVQNDNQGWRGNFLLRRFLLPTVVEMTG